MSHRYVIWLHVEKQCSTPAAHADCEEYTDVNLPDPLIETGTVAEAEEWVERITTAVNGMMLEMAERGEA